MSDFDNLVKSIENNLPRIKNQEDQTLYKEALSCFKIGAYRASYIMFWLCCAESLKRKFKEAGIAGDNFANNRYSRFIQDEKKEKSIDRALISSSCTYGFIDKVGERKLSDFFAMRSVYAHPYQIAPTMNEVYNIALGILDLVLSNEDELGEKYIDDIINKIETPIGISTIDSDAKKFLKQRIIKISKKYIFDSFKKVIRKLKSHMANTIVSQKLLIAAEIIFSRLEQSDKEGANIHDLIINYPDIFELMVSENNLADYGETNRASILEYLFQHNKLSKLQLFFNNGKLNEKEKAKFRNTISSNELRFLASNGIELKYTYEQVLKGLKSFSFDENNVACEYILSKLSELSTLTPEQQVTLGRQITRISPDSTPSSIGSHRAGNLLKYLPNNITESFAEGIMSEIFEISEIPELRKKDLHIKNIPYLNLAKISKTISQNYTDNLIRKLDNLTSIEGDFVFLCINNEKIKDIYEKISSEYARLYISQNHSPQSSTSTHLHSS